eukprot:TRINITY_DN2442_c0_g2_i1.p1 TRINITY_DN2442_c0_g2~~TRINITY_DN2442_c0_g2_i1.p1  ORF type:complete len:326 (+),score=86.16 TRINITY_DN2442_c0_g2_i1:51-1028(+)
MDNKQRFLDTILKNSPLMNISNEFPKTKRGSNSILHGSKPRLSELNKYLHELRQDFKNIQEEHFDIKQTIQILENNVKDIFSRVSTLENKTIVANKNDSNDKKNFSFDDKLKTFDKRISILESRIDIDMVKLLDKSAERVKKAVEVAEYADEVNEKINESVEVLQQRIVTLEQMLTTLAHNDEMTSMEILSELSGIRKGFALLSNRIVQLESHQSPYGESFVKTGISVERNNIVENDSKVSSNGQEFDLNMNVSLLMHDATDKSLVQSITPRTAALTKRDFFVENNHQDLEVSDEFKATLRKYNTQKTDRFSRTVKPIPYPISNK